MASVIAAKNDAVRFHEVVNAFLLQNSGLNDRDGWVLSLSFNRQSGLLFNRDPFADDDFVIVHGRRNALRPDRTYSKFAFPSAVEDSHRNKNDRGS